jgi:hypothetical protein
MSSKSSIETKCRLTSAVLVSGKPMLDRLQLRRVGRKEQKMDMLRHAQPGARMPPGPVQHQNNFLVGTGLHVSGKRFEFRFEESNAHTGGEMADGTA